MKDHGSQIPERTCPKCGRIYRAHPAVSRDDNETLICPDCGILEALASIGCPEDDQRHILDTIHAFSGGQS